jgi:hypothetical protein
MKILLDERVTKHLKPHLSEYDVFTVREMQWSGIKNGNLMKLCTELRFDILLTIHKNLQYQQNLEKYELTIVVLNSFSSKVEELAEFISEFRKKATSFEKHRGLSFRTVR